jgi:hypothetical protein
LAGDTRTSKKLFSFSPLWDPQKEITYLAQTEKANEKERAKTTKRNKTKQKSTSEGTSKTALDSLTYPTDFQRKSKEKGR